MITREYVESFLRDLIECRCASTAETRYRGLRQFFAWAAERARSPPPHGEDEAARGGRAAGRCAVGEDLQALLATCTTNDFEGRRDTAIIRLFLDSGLRLAELTGLTMDEVDLGAGMVGVTGKGDRYRTASFGAKTAKAVDRYLRMRRGRPDAASPMLWLGLKGPMTTSGSGRCYGDDQDRPGSNGCTPTNQALLRSRMVRRRRHRGRLDDARRMAYPVDGHEVRSQHPGRARARCAQAAGTGRPAVKDRYLPLTYEGPRASTWPSSSAVPTTAMSGHPA